jgi:hypothetical protein
LVIFVEFVDFFDGFCSLSTVLNSWFNDQFSPYHPFITIGFLTPQDLAHFTIYSSFQVYEVQFDFYLVGANGLRPTDRANAIRPYCTSQHRKLLLFSSILMFNCPSPFVPN